MTVDADSPAAPVASRQKTRTHHGQPKKSEVHGDGMVFLGVRIPKDIHQRLYRAKASLEFSNGKFYGMGRLIERVLKRGLEQIERGLDNPALEDVSEVS